MTVGSNLGTYNLPEQQQSTTTTYIHLKEQTQIPYQEGMNQGMNLGMNQGLNQGLSESYGNQPVGQNYGLTTVVPGQSVNLQSIRDRIVSPGQLFENEFLKAPTKDFYARLQSDGNFVIYTNANFDKNYAIWETNTDGKGHGPYTLRIQEDGNLVLYDRDVNPLWTSLTDGKGVGPFQLLLTDDGNLTLFDRNQSLIWDTDRELKQKLLYKKDKSGLGAALNPLHHS